ncbi:MAG TPA: DNA polymerase III subunit delta [Steroidobacteraceae bacterium]|nr:DNA polymerase III subunit delta [Steroidobacteraceae bacterium]HRX89659.1 DNA polymerase III subunit delta [Steroidobacteraceae bacterium]
MKLNADNLCASLEQGLRPAYLLSGDEPLLVSEAADAIRTAARAQGFEERDVYFIERASDWSDVLAGANNLSLFGARKLLELRLPSAKPGVAGSKAIVQLLEQQDRDTVVLMLTGKLDRDTQNSAWVRAFATRGAWLPLWPVDAARLPAWLGTRARRAGLDLSREALAFIAERCEGNLLAAQQELDKLRLLVPTGHIGLAAVQAAVADSARYDVYQLGEAALAGDVARALRILAGLRGEGVEPTLALWSLAREIRNLWNAVQPQAPSQRAWQRSSAALEQGKRRAHKLPYPLLAERAARTDRMIKGLMPGDAWDEMALLISELAGIRALPLVAAWR